jgi:hypothetical protein
VLWNGALFQNIATMMTAIVIMQHIAVCTHGRAQRITTRLHYTRRTRWMPHLHGPQVADASRHAVAQSQAELAPHVVEDAALQTVDQSRDDRDSLVHRCTNARTHGHA